jgi:hypothetical protein
MFPEEMIRMAMELTSGPFVEGLRALDQGAGATRRARRYPEDEDEEPVRPYEPITLRAPRLSDETRQAAQRYGINAGTAAQHIRNWQSNNILGPENSALFQRRLYEEWTGRQAPEHYTGFHASQIDRIQNVVSEDEADLDVMRQIAVLATMLREMEQDGWDQEYMSHYGGW